MIVSERLTVAATVPAVTADEVKQSARIDDDRFDPEIDRLIAQATEAAEQETGRRLLAQTWRLELDEWPCEPLVLPQSPVVSVTEITYWDGADWATLGTSVYKLVQGRNDFADVRLKLDQSWPTLGDETGPRVRIDYVAGYGDEAADVPPGVRQWILAHCAHWITHPAASTDREAPPNPYLARLLDKTRAYA